MTSLGKGNDVTRGGNIAVDDVAMQGRGCPECEKLRRGCAKTCVHVVVMTSHGLDGRRVRSAGPRRPLRAQSASLRRHLRAQSAAADPLHPQARSSPRAIFIINIYHLSNAAIFFLRNLQRLFHMIIHVDYFFILPNYYFRQRDGMVARDDARVIRCREKGRINCRQRYFYFRHLFFM